MTERYEIRLAGHLSAALLSVFEGMTASERSAETILQGTIRDQTDLHSLLRRADELGLKLIAVRKIDEETPIQVPPAEERPIGLVPDESLPRRRGSRDKP